MDRSAKSSFELAMERGLVSKEKNIPAAQEIPPSNEKRVFGDTEGTFAEKNGTFEDPVRPESQIYPKLDLGRKLLMVDELPQGARARYEKGEAKLPEKPEKPEKPEEPREPEEPKKAPNPYRPRKKAAEGSKDKIRGPKRKRGEAPTGSKKKATKKKAAKKTKSPKVTTKAQKRPQLAKKGEAKPFFPEPKDRPRADGVEILYDGPFYSYSGFSNMNRELVFRLADRGATVKVQPANMKNKIDPDLEARLDKMQGNRVDRECPKIFGQTMPALMGHAGHRILYTMIETSNGLHPDYAAKANMTNEIWVPSPYLKDLMESEGILPPIKSMPLGVDEKIFRPDVTPMKLPSNAKSFKFLSVFWWSHRKGGDVLLKAFAREFTSKDDVSLVISTKLHAGREPLEAYETARAIMKSSGNPDPPSIIFHTSSMTKEELASLYSACDAFCLMSRGEGFGLPYFEAGAAGLPVIATNVTAQSSFLDNDLAWMVEPDGYEVSKANVGAMAKWCSYYEDQQFPAFGGPAIAQLQQHMRDIYENRGDPAGKADRLRKKILSELTWDDAVDRIITRLNEIKEGSV
jgi:glycosyltransferase involved in cell wall biosynthesis